MSYPNNFFYLIKKKNIFLFRLQCTKHGTNDDLKSVVKIEINIFI